MPTIASVVGHEISNVKKQILIVADVMPEVKFNFLNIPGDVRSFGVQLKHVATSNYYIWSPLTGDKRRKV